MRYEGPGLFDLQVNGYAGVDFNCPRLTTDDVHRAAEKMREAGVTAWLATLITSPLDDFVRCARTIVAAQNPAVVGIHMEGPYINPADGPRGAHRRDCVQPPSWEDFQRRQEYAEGQIRLITIAPELPNSLEFIERAVASGVRVAIGHSDATPAQIAEAVRAGATMSTHLGNGCAHLLPRHPNLLWAQLAEDRLWAGLIVDGIHLSPETVKVMVRAKTPSRCILVTDAVAAAHAPPGSYTVGDLPVLRMTDGRVTLPDRATLAGSSLTMDQAIVHTCRFTGLPLTTVWAMASDHPAQAMGISPRGWVIVEWNPEPASLQVCRVFDRADS